MNSGRHLFESLALSFLKMMRLLRFLCCEEGGNKRELFARRLEERRE